MGKVKVDVFTDYACPFCYMGKRNLENAIKNLGVEDDVEINFKAYELNEKASSEGKKLKIDSMIEKSEEPAGVVMAKLEDIKNQARDIGLEFNYNKVLDVNTRDAHRITKYAVTKGKQLEFSEVVMDAYFNKGINIAGQKELMDLAIKSGLDKKEVLEILNSKKYEEDINKDKYDAFQYQVESVPFFLFENRYGAPGRQTVKVFEEALEKIIKYNNENNK